MQTNAKPIVGIVTVLYNSDDVLEGFFSSLQGQVNVAYRLYVIDNSAEDSGSRLSHGFAEKFGIDMKCIFNNANVGVAKGNNQGIELALLDGCDFIILANNDVEFKDPSLLQRLIAPLQSNSAQIVVPKITYYGTNKIWYAGGSISSWKGISLHVGYTLDDAPEYNRAHFTGYAPTCFMAISSKVFKTVGLMDENYFVYYDDTDFVFRCLQNDVQMLYDPTLLVEHKVSFSTGGGESKFGLYYLNRNRVYFILKNIRGFKRWYALVFTFTSRAFRHPRHIKFVYKSLLDGWRLYHKEHQLQSLPN